MNTTNRPHLLIYDIPERRLDPIQNPSGRLYSRAVRVNLSCWVIMEDQIPYQLLHDLASRGATWHIVPFSDDAMLTLQNMIRQSVQQQLADANIRTQESLSGAIAKLEESLADPEKAGKADKAFGYATKAALKRARTLFGDLTTAVKTFGIEPSSLKLNEALTSVKGLYAQAHTRAKLVAAAAEEAKRVGGEDGAKIAAAAAADAIPVGMLADFVEERGGDTEALREAFAAPAATVEPTPKAVIVPEISSSLLKYDPKTHTFSGDASNLLEWGLDLPNQFRIKSARTGNVRTFTAVTPHRIADGGGIVQYSDGEGNFLCIRDN